MVLDEKMQPSPALMHAHLAHLQKMCDKPAQPSFLTVIAQPWETSWAIWAHKSGHFSWNCWLWHSAAETRDGALCIVQLVLGRSRWHASYQSDIKRAPTTALSLQQHLARETHCQVACMQGATESSSVCESGRKAATPGGTHNWI